MDFQEYKKNKSLKKAYNKACEIQEGLALATLIKSQQDEVPEQEYEGHLAIYDILNKIDSMIRCFEKYLDNNSYRMTSEQMINIIENLYDLADIKLCEAKTKCLKYMSKISGECPCDKNIEINTKVDEPDSSIEIYSDSE